EAAMLAQKSAATKRCERRNRLRNVPPLRGTGICVGCELQRQAAGTNPGAGPRRPRFGFPQEAAPQSVPPEHSNHHLPADKSLQWLIQHGGAPARRADQIAELVESARPV